MSAFQDGYDNGLQKCKDYREPGDLDEGIKALLVFRRAGDADRQGAGFDRVRAFREGVIDGAQPCLDCQV